MTAIVDDAVVGVVEYTGTAAGGVGGVDGGCSNASFAGSAGAATAAGADITAAGGTGKGADTSHGAAVSGALFLGNLTEVCLAVVLLAVAVDQALSPCRPNCHIYSFHHRHHTVM